MPRAKCRGLLLSDTTRKRYYKAEFDSGETLEVSGFFWMRLNQFRWSPIDKNILLRE